MYLLSMDYLFLIAKFCPSVCFLYSWGNFGFNTGLLTSSDLLKLSLHHRATTENEIIYQSAKTNNMYFRFDKTKKIH